jgi:hypothetical protein
VAQVVEAQLAQAEPLAQLSPLPAQRGRWDRSAIWRGEDESSLLPAITNGSPFNFLALLVCP